jgi:hypothetical protein
MFADPRAKASKQPAAEAIGKLRRSAEKHAIDQPPKLHNQCRPSAEIWRQLKQRKVLQHKLTVQKVKHYRGLIHPKESHSCITNAENAFSILFDQTGRFYLYLPDTITGALKGFIGRWEILVTRI